jgi:hypothetical protein
MLWFVEYILHGDVFALKYDPIYVAIWHNYEDRYNDTTQQQNTTHKLHLKIPNTLLSHTPVVILDKIVLSVQDHTCRKPEGLQLNIRSYIRIEYENFY